MSEKLFSHNFAKIEEDLPPRKIYSFQDYPQSDSIKPFNNDSNYSQNTPIAIDFGKTYVRMGMAGTENPYLNFPTLSARYRDRKNNKSSTFIGYDVFYDSTIKANMKNPHDGQMLTNWDAVEKILDYSFLHLNVNSINKINNPIIFNETLATPLSQRQNLSELFFETYDIPSIAFGIDSLFSYYQNNGKSGLIIGTNHESTSIIPILNNNPLINITKRINIGGHQLNDFLKCSIGLKYPYFPTRLNDWQIQNLIKDHCYISKNFNNEINHSLDLNYLEKNDITIEAPFNEILKEEKSDEQLKLDEIKRKENIKKLQDQAKLKRLEKLQLKQKDFEYYSKIKDSFSTMSKREIIDTIRESGFDDENDLNKYLLNLEKSLKKAKLLETDDDDDNDDDENNKYDFSILDKPSSELSPDEIKEKRRLRLIKSNIDSKLRARKEKEEAIKEAEEIRQKDIEFRLNNLESWINNKRQLLDSVVKRRKERLKLKNELGDRKSRASQQRMKNIASLADDAPIDLPINNKRRHQTATIDNDPNDTFGANDDDWSIYRDIAGVDDEELSAEEQEEIYLLEKQLLEFDPNFTINDTQERQFDYKNSIIHKYLRGPRDFDNEDQHQLHQIHLNVERIRIPEIMFQPSITGIDQAGITEVVEDTLLRRLPQELGFSGDISDSNNIKEIFNDIFITGGCALFPNFQSRMTTDIRSFLPTNVSFNVRLAKDPILDAWKGMSKWGYNDFTNNGSKGFWTKQQYNELGIDYMTDNGFGCINLK
ncbi:Nuclear actin-protein involved in chromatin remodeling [Pichia californica]|uniref:Nuclear actin-protein involved in chromatin remodeling n=1 Tax=Pichia californica TaxID=460514 RepID=A0A9P7BHG2_9ASCO|nr:Nuclear actin-protein involved in chromatin remodeling [[Candida] californica]KAG0689989.1 Nuclear actin-protein involved in chromatin remodeling [[Candida] californica]